MSSENTSFKAELSATTRRRAPVAGRIARFELDDGRQVEVQVPRATGGVVVAGEVVGFRILVGRAGDVVAELRGSDLVRVFGARTAALALEAFAAGDLPRARRLARQAGGSWRRLVLLLREVVAARRAATGNGSPRGRQR